MSDSNPIVRLYPASRNTNIGLLAMRSILSRLGPESSCFPTLPSSFGAKLVPSFGCGKRVREMRFVIAAKCFQHELFKRSCAAPIPFPAALLAPFGKKLEKGNRMKYKSRGSEGAATTHGRLRSRIQTRLRESP